MATSSVKFIGVDTRASRVHELFPRWMETFGIDAQIEAVDLPLDSSRMRYRALVESIARDRSVLGAVITSHKLRLFSACSDLFAEIDDDAVLTREASALYRTPHGLGAAARDPVAARAVLDELDVRSEVVLCLGAGGAATAIALALLARDPPPRRMVFTDVRPDRLRALEETLTALASATTDLELAPAERTDALIATLPAGSLVVNATGLGKDAPGSPVGAEILLPEDGVVWELNYRGERPFLTQALRQQRRRRLRVYDGWLYFLYGWFHALEPILGFEASPRLFERLREVSTAS